MFWMAVASAELICLPDCSVVTIVPMFRAIWVNTGKSARAMLIHCVLQPVASSEIDSTIARTVLDFEIELRIGIELDFMIRLLLVVVGVGFESRLLAGSRATMECRRQPATEQLK